MEDKFMYENNSRDKKTAKPKKHISLRKRHTKYFIKL